ncbi:GntR family transcriptional regulator [Kocuria nitroreducens]|uniref:GntR family transcriptional regulator n=1 Tax=Kocuria nitroreducens TaxID=3058914 RepID=UPI0036DD26E1
MTATETLARRGSAEVYAYLRAQILDLGIPPDSKVNIDALGRELGVSQTPIREALHQLEGDNLIVKTPGRGYRTTPLLRFEQLREMFELRLLIEPWGARAAAVNRLSNPGRALESGLKNYIADSAININARHLLVSHDMQFHDQILSASHNEFAHQAIRATHCHLHLFRLYPADWSSEQTIEEHAAIVEAVRDCDPDAAEKAMHDHLMGAYHRFAGAFAQEHDHGPRPSTAVRLC